MSLAALFWTFSLEKKVPRTANQNWYSTPTWHLVQPYLGVTLSHFLQQVEEQGEHWLNVLHTQTFICSYRFKAKQQQQQKNKDHKNKELTSACPHPPPPSHQPTSYSPTLAPTPIPLPPTPSLFTKAPPETKQTTMYCLHNPSQ